MNPPFRRLVVAAAIGQALGLCGWVDPLFVPLVLLGPVVSGAVAAARRIPYAWVAILWCSAGLNMAWTDWLVNREDVGFHLALSAVMPLLAGVAYGTVRLAAPSRRAVTRRSGPA